MSVDVVVGDNRTSYNSFLSWGFHVTTGPTLLKQVISWMTLHLWVPAILGAVVLIGIIVCCCKCRKRKRNEVKPGDQGEGVRRGEERRGEERRGEERRGEERRGEERRGEERRGEEVSGNSHEQQVAINPNKAGRKGDLRT